MKLTHVLLPEVESPVSIETTPNSVCFLGHDSVKGHRLQLDADESGVVRFHARPPKNGQSIELNLECVSDGTATRHKVELRCGTDLSAISDLKKIDAGLYSTGTLRPALEWDSLTLSNQELVSRGYPPRPDPAKSPQRYARWLRKVSRPFTQVKPRKVAHPGVSFSHSRTRPHNEALPRLDLPPRLLPPSLPLPPPIARSLFNANNASWSGAIVTKPIAQFFWVEADWNVPQVFSLPNGPGYSATAEWIGLDSNSTDLYQAGTDSELFSVFGWTFTNYWMWIETLPFAPWGLPSFPLSPRDAVSVDIFVADQNGTTWFQNGSNGGLTGADNSVWFMIYNFTRDLSFWGYLPTAPESGGGVSSSGFTGSSAEFIIERPVDLSNNISYPLAPFGFASMQNCWYGDSEYGDTAWQLGPDGSTPFDGTLTYINMQNGSDTLAIAFSPNGDELSWAWVNYT
jgi:hypothetical protein